MGCVTPQALLSALLLRVEREGLTVAEADWEAVLGAGCTLAQIDQALAPRTGPSFEQPRRSWASVRARRGAREAGS